MANQFYELFTYCDAVIYEFGAGSGAFARDVLTALSELNSLPDRYYIIELSAQLAKRQCTLLSTALPRG